MQILNVLACLRFQIKEQEHKQAFIIQFLRWHSVQRVITGIPWHEFRARFYDLVAACNHRWGIKGQLSSMNLDSLYKLISFFMSHPFRGLERGPIKSSPIWSTNLKNYHYLSKFQLSAVVKMTALAMVSKIVTLLKYKYFFFFFNRKENLSVAGVLFAH